MKRVENTGFVKETTGNMAIVTVYRSSACGEGCGQSCAHCAGAKMVEVSALNEVGAAVGDRVTVMSSTKKTLGYAAALYILPILTGVLGYFVGFRLTGEDTQSAFFAFLGFLAGLIPSVLINRRLSKEGDGFVVTGIER